MNDLTKKIALGTVQFGLNYGVNNKTGIPDDKTVSQIIKYALANEINTIDTAYNYGNSEQRIGNLPFEILKQLNIISKAPGGSNKDNILSYFNDSIKRVGVKSNYGYLLHDFKDYLNDKTIFESLLMFKNKNLVKTIGFSIYHPEELEIILNDDIKLDIVQLPYNLADWRFEKYFSELKKRKVEIYVRSVFLQGLFFMKPEDLNEKIKVFSDFLSVLKKISRKLKRSIENIALNFVLQNDYIDKVIIGVDTVEQLKRNISESKILMTEEEFNYAKDELLRISLPNNLLLPYNWN